MWSKVRSCIHLLIHNSTIKDLLFLIYVSFINFRAIWWKKSAKKSRDRLKQTQFSVEEVLQKLAFDSESDDKPSSFDALEFGWMTAYYTVCEHAKFGRDLQRNTSYGTWSKTTHFLSVICEADVAQ